MIPWVSLAIALLVYLLSGSLIIAIAVFALAAALGLATR